jgi:ADP-heptose:LPS heptosyltransferase
VYVLSRVTLGADIVVSSVLLEAAKQRYPQAEIVFVGPRKNFELFENDPRIAHRQAPYARGGSLAERLRASAALWLDDGPVLDPDSRLSQLGLLALCPESNYFLFESRSYGGDGEESLPDLAARWAREALGVEQARPYIAPLPSHDAPAEITVSLGVGENPAKGLGQEFEAALMRLLAATGASVLVDKGGSDEERRRVESVLLPGMRAHEGAFAPFAAQIARSRLYIGYDSAGGHVASACGVPLIGIAAGFVNDRMRARWRPNGIVIQGNCPGVLDQIQRILAEMRFAAGAPARGTR